MNITMVYIQKIARMKKRYSLDGIIKLCNGNPKFMNEFISLFVETTPAYLDEARTAAEVGNWAHLAEILHKIKPTVEMFSMTLTTELKQLHEDAREAKSPGDLHKRFANIGKDLLEIVGELREDLKQYPPV